MDQYSGLLIGAGLPLLILMGISSLVRYVHHVYFEKYFKLTFEDAPIWSLFYFGFGTALVAVLFPNEMKTLYGPINLTGYVLIAFLLLGVFPAFYEVMRQKVGKPAWLANLFPGQGMLSLEERYIVAKIGDVIFQQCIAGAIVLVLAAQGISYEKIVVIFIVLFTIAHLYIFKTAGFVWGMHYSAYAMLGGFAFPFLIYHIEGGIAYAIILHMLFYVLSAAFFAKLPYPNKAIEKHLGVVRVDK
jgi:hypothetical protein